MTEYKVWAFARSAAPNLPALEEQLAEVMREADRRGYIIVNSCMEQKYGIEFWRPALFAMLTAVQQGRVNAVMVQSLDRLSHDTATLYRILRFCKSRCGDYHHQDKPEIRTLSDWAGEQAAGPHQTYPKKLPWEVFLHADRPASH